MRRAGYGCFWERSSTSIAPCEFASGANALDARPTRARGGWTHPGIQTHWFLYSCCIDVGFTCANPIAARQRATPIGSRVRAHNRRCTTSEPTAMPSSPIDLRSDTVTRPTDAMRSIIAGAAVGDDQYGEDPTTNELQQRVAALLNKEAALWLPSGTMANQVALRLLTQRGDDVIVSREAHAVWHETGGSAANAGVQFTD